MPEVQRISRWHADCATYFPADSAGSIPVTRSGAKSQAWTAPAGARRPDRLDAADQIRLTWHASCAGRRTIVQLADLHHYRSAARIHTDM